MVNKGYEGGIGVRKQSIVRLLEIYCLAGNDGGGGDIKGISQIPWGDQVNFIVTHSNSPTIQPSSRD